MIVVERQFHTRLRCGRDETVKALIYPQTQTILDTLTRKHMIATLYGAPQMINPKITRPVTTPGEQLDLMRNLVAVTAFSDIYSALSPENRAWVDALLVREGHVALPARRMIEVPSATAVLPTTRRYYRVNAAGTHLECATVDRATGNGRPTADTPWWNTGITVPMVAKLNDLVQHPNE